MVCVNVRSHPSTPTCPPVAGAGAGIGADTGADTGADRKIKICFPRKLIPAKKEQISV